MMDFDRAMNVRVNGKEVNRVGINGITIWEKYVPASILLESDKQFASQGDTINLTATVYDKFGRGCPSKIVEFYAYDNVISEVSNPSADSNNRISLIQDFSDKVIECTMGSDESSLYIYTSGYSGGHFDSIGLDLGVQVYEGDVLKIVLENNVAKIYLNDVFITTHPSNLDNSFTDFGIGASGSSTFAVTSVKIKATTLIGSGNTDSNGECIVSYSVQNTEPLYIKAKCSILLSDVIAINLSDGIIWNPPLRGETGELILHSASEANGEVVGKGFLLKEGWSNTGLWECSFEFRHDNIRYTGIIYLANLGTTYNNSDKLTTWEGSFPNDSNYANYRSGTIDWFDITVTKIDETHIRVKSETLNRDSGIIEVTDLPDWERLTIGARHNTSNDYGPSRIRNVIVKKLPSSINLTSSKDILSYVDNDSATLTAQLLDENNNPFRVRDVPVTFEVIKVSDDSLVETLTGTTDSTGVASVSYYGKGAGEIYINASCMNVSKTYELEDCLQVPKLDGSEDITSWTSMTNKTENGIYYSHGSFLTQGWSNAGLWQLDFDVMATAWRYVGLMPICSEEINPYTDAKNQSYSMTTWEGLTYMSGLASTIVSEDSMTKITSLNIWHHVTIKKLSSTQVEIIINNTYHSIRNVPNLANLTTLHIGTRDNPSSRNSGGIIQYKNIKIKSL